MSTTKKFASHADLAEKRISLDKLSEHAYAAERDKEMWQSLEG